MGEVGAARGAGLQAEHQAGDVGGDALQARLALFQGGAGAAALGGVVEEHQQVFRAAEAQEAQRHFRRQPLAVGAAQVAFEAQRAFFAVARAAPEVEPGVHAQAGLEVRQGPLDHLAGGVAEHVLGGAVGVAHVAVPVDPEDAHGAAVDGELRQAQGFLGRLAQLHVAARGEQALLQHVALVAQPQRGGQGQYQQQAEEDAEVLPETGGLPQARVLRLQPALVQLVQLLGRQGAQAGVEDAGQFRQVAAGGQAQQLWITDVGQHAEAGELDLAAEAGQVRLVDHRVAGLLAEHPAQGFAVAVGELQLQARVGAAQVVGYRARAAQRHGFEHTQALQLHGAGTVAEADEQARHPQVGVGEQPVAQAGRGLAEPRRQVDFAGTGGTLQFVLVGIDAPLQAHLQRAGDPVEQLDVGAGELLQAPVLLGVGRIQDHADAQLRVRLQPGALGGVQGHAGRRVLRGAPQWNAQQERRHGVPAQSSHARSPRKKRAYITPWRGEPGKAGA